MKKFLKDLETELKTNDINTDEIKDIIADHQEMILQALAEGISEEDLPLRFGEPKQIADELAQDLKQENTSDKQNLQKHLTFQISEEALDIDVDLISEDISFETSSDNLVHVYSKKDMMTNIYEIRYDNKCLMLTRKDLKQKETYTIQKEVSNNFRVFLPKHTKINIVSIKLVNGDLSYKNIGSDEIKLNNISGDIDVEAVKANKARIHSVSGDIQLQDFNVEELTISVVSGDVKMSELTVKNKLVLHTVNGDYDVKNATCDTLDLQTVSGDLKGNDLTTKKITYKTISGDIHIKNKVNQHIEIIKRSSISGKINIEVK